MKEIILKVDNLLDMLEVRGNSVLILADARKTLYEAYRIAEEEENKEAAEKKEEEMP